MKNPSNPKERNLLKGAIRRVFSRSELRRKIIDATEIIGYVDVTRPRVRKWSRCPVCNEPTPKYLMECDHVVPIVGTTESLDRLTWDQIVDRLWCDESNLLGICKPCHKTKSKVENKLRRQHKKDSK